MKKIEAIIRPEKLTVIHQALIKRGISGMTILDAFGAGKQQGYSEIFRGTEYDVRFLPRIKLEVIIDEDILDQCLEVIMSLGRTGNIGDGKIFISTIDEMLSIRTGESGVPSAE